MAKKGFIKYEYENIRTDYKNFTTTALAPANKIEARNIVKFDGTSNKLVTTTDAVNNTSVFMLSEDVLPTDQGFVYYIIENNSNLI